ncbi:MAG TPA: TolC family outer membrane protein [Pseudomonadales bacterium]
MTLRLAALPLALLLCAGTGVRAAEIVDANNVIAMQQPGRTLEDFFTAALNNNPELNISRERWAVMTARKDQTNGQLLPQITANANVSDNERQETARPEITYTGERYTLQLSQVLFNWGAFAARGQAYLLEDQSESEYYAQVAQLLTEVADAYLGVLQQEDALGSIESEYEAMTNQLDRVQDLYDLQLARITDLYDAQARLAAIQAERVTIESELALARENLRAVSGLEAGALARLPEEIAVQPLQDGLDVWLQRTRENNRLIEARQLALQAAEKQVSRQRGAHMPRVSLVVQQQNTNTGFDNILLPSGRTDSTYVGLDFSVPIFSGGSARAGVREAQSMRNIAANELRQAELDLIEQTRNDFLLVRAGEARIEAGQALAESTDTSYTAMLEGFELGTVTSVDVLNALRDRFRAERDLQAARYDHIRAGLALRRDAGVLTADDMRGISDLLNVR